MRNARSHLLLAICQTKVKAFLEKLNAKSQQLTASEVGIAPILIILGVILTTVAVGATIVAIRNNQTPTSQVAPTQQITVDYLSSDQVSLDNIKSSPLLKSTTTLPDGATQYQIASSIDSRDNLVIAKDNQIIFRRVVLLNSQSPLPTFSQYHEKLGQPSENYLGSKYYGTFVSTEVYPSQGTALVGNANTDEIFEIQLFNPTTLADYLSIWGSDIDETNYQNSETF